MNTKTPVVVMVGCYLRQGRSVALEAAARSLQEEQGKQAVIVEGGPGTLTAPPGVELVQLAPGCVCCVGQLPLRVTVARMLRLVKPARLWIEVSQAEHLPELRKQLDGPGFAGAIDLQDAPMSR
jgi:G3E family GTPase